MVYFQLSVCHLYVKHLTVSIVNEIEWSYMHLKNDRTESVLAVQNEDGSKAKRPLAETA